MKILKRILVIFVFLFQYLLCFSHSGRTDGNGGHWNHSTGKYHSHEFPIIIPIIIVSIIVIAFIVIRVSNRKR